MTSRAEVARQVAPIVARWLARLDEGPEVVVHADVPVSSAASLPAAGGRNRSSVCVDHGARAVSPSTRPTSPGADNP